MSPGGLALLAPGIGNVGDRVIAYLDHIGRVEGKITRIIDNGFAMKTRAPRGAFFAGKALRREVSLLAATAPAAT